MYKIKILIVNGNYYNKEDLERIKKIKNFRVTIKNTEQNSIKGLRDRDT